MKKALSALIVLTVLAAATVAFTQSSKLPLGFSKGPAQPIAFSHKRHAGDMGMDCLYCHNGADKSSIANIPPMSTCMGCHKIVSPAKPTIQKLAGYWERKEQIPWVEVYRLPDHVKFNHKRHVKAGIECQSCHGPVETMDVVYQFPSLKMGWCVTCHRQNLDHPEYPATMDCLVCHH
jgi:hypothetical protein